MAKRQSRRTISINRALYELAKGAAERTGVPLSQLTEKALRGAIARDGLVSVVRAPGAWTVYGNDDAVRVSSGGSEAHHLKPEDAEALATVLIACAAETRAKQLAFAKSRTVQERMGQCPP